MVVGGIATRNRRVRGRVGGREGGGVGVWASCMALDRRVRCCGRRSGAACSGLEAVKYGLRGVGLAHCGLWMSGRLWRWGFEAVVCRRAGGVRAAGLGSWWRRGAIAAPCRWCRCRL